MSRSRLKEFEALRGLSILLLMSLHSDIYDPSVFGEALRNIGAFVASFLLGSFFFLAGYFTEVSLGKPQRSAGNFIWSKFIRIYPPYWLGLILFIYVLEYDLNRSALAVYILNLQAVFAPVYVKSLLTLWYISMLVVFYILFGGLMIVIRSNAGLIAASIVIFLAASLSHQAFGLFDLRFFQYYFIFLAGVFFCRFESFRAGAFEWNILGKIIAAAISALIFNWVMNTGFDNGLPLLAADLFILSWILLGLTVFRTGLGSWKLWSWLSTASYFAYLIHRPIWRVIDNAFDLEPGLNTVLIHLIPGAMIALVAGYFLQNGYDRLLAALRLK